MQQSTFLKKILLAIVLACFLFFLWVLFPDIFTDYIKIWLALGGALLAIFLISCLHIIKISLDSALAIGVIMLTALFFLLQNIQTTENSIDEVTVANQYNCLTAAAYVQEIQEDPSGLYLNPFLTDVYNDNLGVLREKLGQNAAVLPHALSALTAANAEITLNEASNDRADATSSVYRAGFNISLLHSSTAIVGYLTEINGALGGADNFCDLALFASTTIR